MGPFTLQHCVSALRVSAIDRTSLTRLILTHQSPLTTRPSQGDAWDARRARPGRPRGARVLLVTPTSHNTDRHDMETTKRQHQNCSTHGVMMSALQRLSTYRAGHRRTTAHGPRHQRQERTARADHQRWPSLAEDSPRLTPPGTTKTSRPRESRPFTALTLSASTRT